MPPGGEPPAAKLVQPPDLRPQPPVWWQVGNPVASLIAAAVRRAMAFLGRCALSNKSLFSTVLLSLVAHAALGQTFIGPGEKPYLSRDDSPWDTNAPGFNLLTFEDSQLLPTGVGTTGGIGHFGGLTDSVDADDGVIDGSGISNGFISHSVFGGGVIDFTFDALLLGALPQRAGIVWTDGSGFITFEAFDANGNSLGTISGDHADGSSSSTTGDDRFYGVEYAGGIGRIQIRNTSGGTEADHLQYGPVPTPGALSVLGLSGLIASRRRRN